MGGWGNFQDEHEPGTVGMEEAIGVKIEFQKYPTDADFWNNLPAQIAAKTAPDFISLTNELYLPYINDGLVVPLTSYVEDGTISCWDSIAQNLKDIWEIDGEIYGIPTHQSPAVFAINMNLWNEAGLTEDDFPETWDDVLEICQVFKDQLGLTGLCLNTQEFHFTQYALSFGGGWGLGKTINTPENAAALQFLIDAYHQGYVVTPKELGVGYDGSVLMTNDAAMSTGGSWYINDFAKNAPDVEVRYIKIPHAEGHEDAAGTFHAPAYAILKGGAHEKETAMAINYLMNDARYEAIIDLGYIPVDEKFFDEFREKQPFWFLCFTSCTIRCCQSGTSAPLCRPPSGAWTTTRSSLRISPSWGGIRIRPFPPCRWCWATLSSRPWRATAWPGSGSRAKR